MPFRDWCRHCIRGKSTDSPHLRSDIEHDFPTVSMDYCYMCSEAEGEKESEADTQNSPILVMHDDKSEAHFAYAVEKKGGCSVACQSNSGLYRRTRLRQDNIEIRPRAQRQRPEERDQGHAHGGHVPDVDGHGGVPGWRIAGKRQSGARHKNGSRADHNNQRRPGVQDRRLHKPGEASHAMVGQMGGNDNNTVLGWGMAEQPTKD